MSTPVSPLAPTEVPDMPVIAGVKLATAAASLTPAIAGMSGTSIGASGEIAEDMRDFRL